MPIGKNIRTLAANKGISLYRIAKNAGISQSYLNEIVNEKRTNPSITILTQIANALDASIDDLIKI